MANVKKVENNTISHSINLHLIQLNIKKKMTYMKMKFKSIGQKLQNEQWYLCVIIKTFNAKKKKGKVCHASK